MSMKEVGERYRWKILAIVYLSMLAFAFVFQSIPPVLSLIIRELKITHTQAGMLMSLFALPGIFITIPGGILSDYYGAKRMGSTSLGLMAIGTAVSATAQGFSILALGRLIAGIGAVTFAVVAPQILSQWFFKKELGLAMGVFNTAMPFGTIIAFNSFGELGSNMGWRLPILVTAFFSIISLFAFLLIYKPAPVTETQKKSSAILANPFRVGKKIWLVGAAWMWFNAGVIAFMTFAPDYFVQKGFDLAYAGFLTSIIMFAALVLNPVIGYIAHRFNAKETFIAAGGISLAGILFLISSSSLPILPLMILLGIAAAFIPAPIFSLPSDVMPQEKLGMGFGIITALLNVGIVLGPYFVGLARDITGNYQASFLLMAGFTFLVSPTILALKV